MNEIIDWITLIIMWACIFSWIFQIILIKKERKKINTTYKDIQKNARLIDEYIISLDNPAELATERCVNIVTNLREIIVANRRTIDSYFDKFNKLQRKIKKLEDRIKANEIRRDIKRAEEAQD